MEDNKIVYCFQFHHKRTLDGAEEGIYVSRTEITEYFRDMLNESICRYRDEKTGSWRLFDLRRLDIMQQGCVYTYEDNMCRAMKIMLDTMRVEREKLLYEAERRAVYTEVLADLINKTPQTP